MKNRQYFTTLASLLALFSVLAVSAVAADQPRPLARAHAHNDYLHHRPLLDALDCGFTSAEADIHLIDGRLLVAHDRDKTTNERTLSALYLEPLRERVQKNGGQAHAAATRPFTLLIDFKTEAESTYRALRQELERYENILTVFGPESVRPGAVTVIVSGNRPIQTMRAEKKRLAACDGRLSDLETKPISPPLFPLISDRWTSHFTWSGAGPMPEKELAKLHDIVRRAHADGRRVRFWSTPDFVGPSRQAVWRELIRADVDHINTDDLRGLQKFLLQSQVAAPSRR